MIKGIAIFGAGVAVGYYFAKNDMAKKLEDFNEQLLDLNGKIQRGEEFTIAGMTFHPPKPAKTPEPTVPNTDNVETVEDLSPYIPGTDVREQQVIDALGSDIGATKSSKEIALELGVPEAEVNRILMQKGPGEDPLRPGSDAS